MKLNFKPLVQLALILIALLVIAPIGCATRDPVTAAKVQKIQSKGAIAVATATTKGAVDLQNAKNKVSVDTVKGQGSPVTHPIDYANNLVNEIHGPLFWVTLISWLLFGIAFGLSFTKYNFLDSYIPGLRMFAVLSLVALFALPLVPIGIYAVIAAAVGLLTYELIKDKGNPEEAIEDTETLLGFKSQQQSAGTTIIPPAKPVEIAKPVEVTKPVNPQST